MCLGFLVIASSASSFFPGGNRLFSTQESVSLNSQSIALASNLPYVNSRTLAVGGAGSSFDDAGVATFPPLSSGGVRYDAANPCEAVGIYEVREGDTASQIAEMFDISLDTLIWANSIEKHIFVGQHLVVLPFTGVRHQIASGDTRSSIARKYGVDPEDVVTCNENGGTDTEGTLVVGNFANVLGGEKRAPAPAPRETRLVSAPSTSVAQQPSSVSSGYFIRPIRGGIRTQGLHARNAVDLAASFGTPIYASADGRVTRSLVGCASSGSWGCGSGYGNYIVIEHPNGTRTLYSHNQRNIVSEGEYVRQGQVIGYVGSSGNSTGPHVHFEVHGAVNPF